MRSADVEVLVASHKPYWMPADALYVPVQVGAKGNKPIAGFVRDDSGDNISADNPRYCELTALYWGWKNAADDYMGLVHYRRHFKGSGQRGTLTLEEARALLAHVPLVLPKLRKYYIETVESHYGHTHDSVHVECLRSALGYVSPEYLPAFEAVMSQVGFHAFNMCIMRRDLLDEYCSWLFEVLNLAEAGVDFTGMDAFQQRCVGRMGEFLLDTWVHANKVPYDELPVVGMERTNWLRKGGAFAAAKFLGKRYDGSF